MRFDRVRNGNKDSELHRTRIRGKNGLLLLLRFLRSSGGQVSGTPPQRASKNSATSISLLELILLANDIHLNLKTDRYGAISRAESRGQNVNPLL